MGMLKVSNLGKAYKSYDSRWARLAEWLTPFPRPRHTLNWVLRDINFTVNPGESIGILGVNGAGKSTLLKLITGTIQPTTGNVQISGSVAALLELGMGFHPDFTGCQNVYMAGQLLGLKEEQISGLMPEIKAFAEIGDYINQPVRIYSSGMQVRLDFAVATALPPDLLIVDEALAVGDVAFQRKCFQRIENYRKAGTTLLYVSHDIETVKKLCDRAIFVENGNIASIGAAKKVCEEYERRLFGSREAIDISVKNSQAAEFKKKSRFDPSLVVSSEVVYGNGKAVIESAWLECLEGKQINIIESGCPFSCCYRVNFLEDAIDPIFCMMIKTVEGIALYGVDSTSLTNSSRSFQKGDKVTVRFNLKNSLAPGVFFVNCAVRQDSVGGVEFLSRRVDFSSLKVIAGNSSSVVSGLLDMQADLSVISEPSN